MLEGEPTPDRRTPIAHKVVDRLLPKKREACKEHCHCVTAMRLKVGLLFFVFSACLAYFIPRELYGWMRARDVPAVLPTSSSAEVMTIDRAPPRDAGRP